MVNIDINKCKSCGLCVKECFNNVFELSNNNGPQVIKEDYCIQCGRCVAICRDDALDVDGINSSKMKPVIKDGVIDSDNLKRLIESKRSWRRYKDKRVSKEELNKLLDIAQIAPTAMNSQEKSFIVVEDEGKIEEIKKAVIKDCRGVYKLMKFLSSSPVKYIFPKETREHFLRAKHDFESMLSACDNGVDQLFHNAPCLVLFTGVGLDPMGKDNALFAMSNFMLLAESMGIGTCINGFASAGPKTLAKLVDTPKLHKVFGVLTVGYKKGSFHKTIYRKDPVVKYYE